MGALLDSVRAAWPARQADAKAAFTLFRSYCTAPVSRVPGMDTVLRLAIRLDAGNSIEQAAAREYIYRWHLVLNQWVNFAETDRPRSRNSCRSVTGSWQPPHLIGL